jgi:iron complex outermembrane recepter protein
MSNNMNTSPMIRWQLLSTVSAFAMLTSTYAAGAAGNDADRPSIWIELGGQMENVSGQGEVFAPAFLSAYSASAVLQNITPLQAQKPPPFSFGAEGKISFQPEDSDWVFSAAARFGRSSNFRRVHHQTDRVFEQPYKYGTGTQITTVEKFADTQSGHRESHAVLDFSAGKDVGLGLFGRETSSTLSAGVRFAQFESRSTFDLRARPDLRAQYKYYGTYKLPFPPNLYCHTYHAIGQASREFHGIGPSLSWSGSAPFAGNPQQGEITFDWGANAALLFGKQRANVRHQESAHYKAGLEGAPYSLVYENPVRGHTTDRSITVPNIGGSVGLSWRVQDFKVSMGYRYDTFLKAMDTGIDAAKKSNLTFNGPYASISIGLGD